MSIGGRYFWLRNHGEDNKPKGIFVVFEWMSIMEVQLKDSLGVCSSLGWNALVCCSDYLNPFFPDRASSFAFSVLNEIVKELRSGLCPVVLVSFSGGSKACMYKIFQIIEGCSELQLNLEDRRLVASCISGQIYNSDPVDVTYDFGARLALHHSALRIPGSSKLLSFFAKGVTLSLDALFITRFGSQRTEYWQTLFSSVGLDAPFLILCYQEDGVVPFSTVCNFAQRLKEVGGNVKVVKWTTSSPPGLLNDQAIQHTAAVTLFLEQAVAVFSRKIKKLGERSLTDLHNHDEISNLICDLQNAAVDSNQSFRRIAEGPNDHFFLPSSSIYRNSKENGSLQEERKERSPNRSGLSMSSNSVLGQILFNACVPKTVEGWDVKFSGSLNGEPVASIHRRSPFSGIKHRSKL